MIEQILLKHKKGVFSILNPIYNIKYDIDNYNIMIDLILNIIQY